MEVSKVRISESTHLMNALTPKKRKLLRQERVKALINSKPNGTILRARDFARALDMKQANAWVFVLRMVEQGHISKYNEGRRSYSWTVRETEADYPTIATNEVIANTIPTSSMLEQAKQFAWEHNSDSLRDFITWLEARAS